MVPVKEFSGFKSGGFDDAIGVVLNGAEREVESEGKHGNGKGLQEQSSATAASSPLRVSALRHRGPTLHKESRISQFQMNSGPVAPHPEFPPYFSRI
jgi:hypothetical protein